jgi:hypothetical protein
MEHCHGEGAKIKFLTKNTGIVTCPETEWNIVVGEIRPDEDTRVEPEYETGSGGGTEDRERKVRRLEDLERLQTSRKAELIRSEIIAVVLYTGPMVFIVYNA